MGTRVLCEDGKRRLCSDGKRVKACGGTPVPSHCVYVYTAQAAGTWDAPSWTVTSVAICTADVDSLIIFGPAHDWAAFNECSWTKITHGPSCLYAETLCDDAPDGGTPPSLPPQSCYLGGPPIAPSSHSCWTTFWAVPYCEGPTPFWRMTVQNVQCITDDQAVAEGLIDGVWRRDTVNPFLWIMSVKGGDCGDRGVAECEAPDMPDLPPAAAEEGCGGSGGGGVPCPTGIAVTITLGLSVVHVELTQDGSGDYIGPTGEALILDTVGGGWRFSSPSIAAPWVVSGEVPADGQGCPVLPATLDVIDGSTSTLIGTVGVS